MLYIDRSILAISVASMSWSGEHRAFVIEAYFKNNDSVILTQRLFRRHFNLNRHAPVPSRNTILLWVKNFRNTSSALKTKPTGRKRTVRTPENINAVRVAVTRSPRRSAAKHAVALAISDRSVRRILHSDLKFHPYKMMLVQQLNANDWASRKDACEIMLENVHQDAIILSSDEAHFHLSGFVNKQNYRYWAPNNPREIFEKPLHSQYVTVWCAVSKFGIIGPYFFEELNRRVTVTSHRYVNMLNEFLLPKLNDFQGHEIWFQQDGATAHTARIAMDVLRETFPGRLISRFGDIPWPARSPDLAVCDFFLWGYLKHKVFSSRPQSIAELKEAIQREIEAIPQVMIERAMANFRIRLSECVRSNGKHLDDIIFK